MPRDVTELKGALGGRPAFVLGNGPSIRTHDLSLLRGLDVIGMNASVLLEAEHGFRCRYYTVSDARFLNHPQKRPLATSRLRSDTLRVLRDELRESDAPEWIDKTFYVKSRGKNGFSDDLRRGFYFGCTTSMLAIQLAYYAGASTIYLLGNDFRYPPSQPRFYYESNPQPPDPFLSIQLWNIRLAWKELRVRGVDMYVCTRDTNLAPYVPLIDFHRAVENANSHRRRSPLDAH